MAQTQYTDDLGLPYSVWWLAGTADYVAKHPHVAFGQPACFCGACTLPPRGKLSGCQVRAVAAVTAARAKAAANAAPKCSGCPRCRPAARSVQPPQLTAAQLRERALRHRDAWWNTADPKRREQELFLAAELDRAADERERAARQAAAGRVMVSNIGAEPVIG
jgi:hypothetical protein